jgi:hypothetical protein
MCTKKKNYAFGVECDILRYLAITKPNIEEANKTTFGKK